MVNGHFLFFVLAQSCGHTSKMCHQNHLHWRSPTTKELQAKVKFSHFFGHFKPSAETISYQSKLHKHLDQTLFGRLVKESWSTVTFGFLCWHKPVDIPLKYAIKITSTEGTLQRRSFKPKWIFFIFLATSNQVRKPIHTNQNFINTWTKHFLVFL